MTIGVAAETVGIGIGDAGLAIGVGVVSGGLGADVGVAGATTGAQAYSRISAATNPAHVRSVTGKRMKNLRSCKNGWRPVQER